MWAPHSWVGQCSVMYLERNTACNILRIWLNCGRVPIRSTLRLAKHPLHSRTIFKRPAHSLGSTWILWQKWFTKNPSSHFLLILFIILTGLECFGYLSWFYFLIMYKQLLSSPSLNSPTTPVQFMEVLLWHDRKWCHTAVHGVMECAVRDNLFSSS